MTKCVYYPQCTGCSSWDTNYLQQKTNKIDHLQRLLKENNLVFDNKPEFISCGEYAIRHRVDFTIEYDKILKCHSVGFYDTNKKLIHIEQCLQLAPELQIIFSEFTKFRFFFGDSPIQKGSVRLRIGPKGIKGCWLDFSNMDIKNLLEDQRLLTDLLNAGYIVEIGQKGKQLILENNKLKLGPPVLNNWFKTFTENGESIYLLCLISDFTQPSWLSAEALVSQVLKWSLGVKSIKSVLEFGSGIGQFTLSFLKSGLSVDAYEINHSALICLQENAKLNQLQHDLTIHMGDFHRKPISLEHKCDLVFVNPARSGLKSFTDEISKINADYLIYVSCFPESLMLDLKKITPDYNLCNISIIDQFPQTKHFEICCFLKKSY